MDTSPQPPEERSCRAPLSPAETCQAHKLSLPEASAPSQKNLQADGVALESGSGSAGLIRLGKHSDWEMFSLSVYQNLRGCEAQCAMISRGQRHSTLHYSQTVSRKNAI